MKGGDNSTILVTGCSSGIGEHCARALKAQGWRVLATARKDADLARLRTEGFEAFYLDYAEPASIEALVDDVSKATGGRIYALFNNGAYGQAGAVEDLPVEALRAQFEVNVFGWHHLTRRILPLIRANGGGRLVQNSSILGFIPFRGRGAYTASKHAIEALTDTLRIELAGTGIHVVSIQPGPITSKFKENGYAYFLKYIDAEKSVHRAEYEAQIARYNSTAKARFELGPEAVLAKLRHALESASPRTHYRVTFPTHLLSVLKRTLPARAFHAFLARARG
jgi:NAD(P)-dependent dehydrogenase (short-subunit alcohol dehydrogenase family)